ncbi:MAG: glycosyltransferase family 2 protein [Bacteroidia bacterium]|nr:glycosyltransferase [Bacteroidia bacterium]NNC86010.1 glycosyltransferase family 2 protein [Bacteroidia bacterium]NNM15288.1 glycosyltransferase family 2 protein [Bacteroidia bacterium]
MNNTDTHKPILSIVIPTKDRLEIFTESLERAVNAIESVNAEIIVVNDSYVPLGSKFEFNNKVRIYNNNGKGVATARNFGANKAVGELILFLDNDMWLSKENVETYLRLTKELGDVIINLNWVYPKYLHEKIKSTAIGRYLDSKDLTSMKGWNKGNNWNDDELFESSAVASANLLISRKNFNALNGYDETFPFAGWEDFDFSIRVKNSGIRTYIYPKSMMYHNENNKFELNGWLRKNYQSAITQKHAVGIGYTELKQKSSIVKQLIYLIMIPFGPLLLLLAKILSHYKSLDFMYQKLVDALTGLIIYKGYKGYDY